MDKMISIIYMIVLFLLLITSTAGADAESGDKIIERVIKIEGTVEKPRIIFIVPRAKIWKRDIFKKSFFDDILKPVQPGFIFKNEIIKDTQLNETSSP